MKLSDYWKLLGVLIFASFVFWVFAVVALKCFDVAIELDNVILTLVGILATFVVVGNYMQVKEVKDEFNGKVEKEVEKAVKEANVLTSSVREDVNTLKGEISHVREEANRLISEIESQFNDRVNDEVDDVRGEIWEATGRIYFYLYYAIKADRIHNPSNPNIKAAYFYAACEYAYAAEAIKLFDEIADEIIELEKDNNSFIYKIDEESELFYTLERIATRNNIVLEVLESIKEKRETVIK